MPSCRSCFPIPPAMPYRLFRPHDRHHARLRRRHPNVWQGHRYPPLRPRLRRCHGRHYRRHHLRCHRRAHAIAPARYHQRRCHGSWLRPSTRRRPSEVQRIAGKDDLAGLTAVFYSVSYTGFFIPMAFRALAPYIGFTALFLIGSLLAVCCLINAIHG